jgi:hypothetical protein
MNQQPFGLLIPGYPIRTDFVQIEPGKFVLKLNCPGDLAAPLASVTEVGLFLLPNIPLPPGHGVLSYWQITAVVSQQGQPPAATGYELLGPLLAEKPSTVLQTGWAEHEQLVEISSTGVPVTVTIALSIEPIGNIENLAPKPERRLFVAQKVALDLFRYMQSFDSGTGAPGQMVVPNNIFDRWLHRFEPPLLPHSSPTHPRLIIHSSSTHHPLIIHRFENKFRRDPNFFLKGGD